jgi:hypothetical protein
MKSTSSCRLHECFSIGLKKIRLVLSATCALLMIINYSIDEKNELILWKLSSIWMKILNDIAFNLNWIEFRFYSIGFKYN